MGVASYQYHVIEMASYRLVLLLLLLLLVTAISRGRLNVKVSDVKGYTKLKTCRQSTLYQLETNSDYATEPLLIHLVGSRYDIGFAYGNMLSEELSNAYTSLLKSVLGNDWNVVTAELVGLALDWQWNDFLSKELPTCYKEELKGLADGASEAGCAECGKYATRAILMANLPGDLKDMVYVIMNEFNKTKLVDILKHKMEAVKGLQCSMFAVWGSRTNSSKLFSARNLDWNKDTGINKNKLIMVTVPNDGGNPSVSLGFVGLFGTLAGMSSTGLTVHEANLEENVISFKGFPWTIRLRYIMEYAKDLAEARALWEATNNTVGFNHMVASGSDATSFAKRTSKGPVAYALETMYMHTAYFADDDPREANATYQPAGGAAVHIGFPLSEAVWRTNHGYDPVIRKHYTWSQSPSTWSMQRYMFIHNALVEYAKTNVKIDYMEAINITAIAGDKGHDPYVCTNSTDGTNVLSVTFEPQLSTLFVAWERNSGSDWRPAVCSTYVKLNMAEWFKPVPPF